MAPSTPLPQLHDLTDSKLHLNRVVGYKVPFFPRSEAFKACPEVFGFCDHSSTQMRLRPASFQAVPNYRGTKRKERTTG